MCDNPGFPYRQTGLIRGLLLAVAISVASATHAQGTPKAPAAGGPVSLPQSHGHEDALTAAESTGRIDSPPTLTAMPSGAKGQMHPLYEFPLATRSSQQDFHWISNFFDHNPATSEFDDLSTVEDFACGTRSYDIPRPYNHIGIDFTPWPFWWYQMDQNLIEVRAAAGGTLLEKFDGRDDRQCELSSKNSNRVFIQHADGSVATYEHMRTGSVTDKPVGSTIVVGEYLGLVGSSGNSLAPHLHLETRFGPNPADLIDPFDGDCNITTDPGDSWWAAGQQEPYYNPAIAQLATHAILVTQDLLAPACPITSQSPQYDDSPSTTEPFYFAIYLRDERPGDLLNVTLRSSTDPQPIETFAATGAADVDDVPISFYAFEIAPIPTAGRYQLDAVWQLEDDQTLIATHEFELIGDRIFRASFSEN